MSKAHYAAAQKAGKKEVQTLQGQGLSASLPSLDSILKNQDTTREVPLGLVDIPADQIVGTKTDGRTTSFAPNFMPILDDDTEFATKWCNLCQAHLNEGIRDPIIAYEYLNKYYVLEGNKRVSVLKYFQAASIPGYVTRVIPAWQDTPEIRLYYEFLEFYNATNIIYLTFTKEGSYKKLVRLTGKKNHERWTVDERIDFRSCYLRFSEAYASVFGETAPGKCGDAFLFYLDVFGYEQAKNEVPNEMTANLKKAKDEMALQQTDSAPEQKTEVQIDPTPDTKGKLITQIFTPSSQKIEKIGFVHMKNADTSAWTYAHEFGRTYVNDVFNGKVRTSVYDNNLTEEDAMNSITRAIDDGNNMLFVTAPEFLNVSLKAAIQHPEIKILNCSLDNSHNIIRTYYARMFEAKVLSGILAGTMTDTNKIGYISTYPIAGEAANINAFAIGVKTVNPRARIYLEWSSARKNQGVDIAANLASLGCNIISHHDMITPSQITRRYGLYRISDGNMENLALPIWDWGKFYERVIRNVQRGTWNNEDKTASGKATSYWWGMSSGVIDLIWSPAVPRETANMLEALKKSIIDYNYFPFKDQVRPQDALSENAADRSMTFQDVNSQDWLMDNIIGSIPTMEELIESARPFVKKAGMEKIKVAAAEKEAAEEAKELEEEASAKGVAVVDGTKEDL